MTKGKEQSHLSFFTSAWPVLLWLPCSPVSVTLSFLNNGFQAGYAALMGICKIYRKKPHYQCTPGPQAPGKEHIPAGLLLAFPQLAGRGNTRGMGAPKAMQLQCNSQHQFIHFFIKNALVLILPRRERGTDHLFKLMLLGLFLFCRNTGNYLCICYGRLLPYLQAETWTSLCT